jgi:hypothetical protein
MEAVKEIEALASAAGRDFSDLARALLNEEGQALVIKKRVTSATLSQGHRGLPALRSLEDEGGSPERWSSAFKSPALTADFHRAAWVGQVPYGPKRMGRTPECPTHLLFHENRRSDALYGST